MLIRCKIIYRNSAWFYTGKKIHDAHIVQDNGNHIKLYKGKKSGQDPHIWLFELKTEYIGTMTISLLFFKYKSNINHNV